MIGIVKILVTGGAGFIGTHLVKHLLQTSCHITILDNLDSQVHGENAVLSPEISPYVTFIKGDVCNYEHCTNALADQDMVIHLAADTATGQSMYEINKCTLNNINGTANLLQCMSNSQHTVKKIILASSRAVYGEGKYKCKNCGNVYPSKRKLSDLDKHLYEPKCPKCGRCVEKTATDEESPVKPQSIYGITKLTQEQYISVLCNALGIPYTILRFQNVYGEGQALNNPYTGILSTFSAMITSCQQVRIFEDGLESRDFIHVQDVVTAILKVMKSSKANNKVLNVGSGKSITLIEITEMLYKVFNKVPNYIINNEYRVGDIRHNYANINAIYECLGFFPEITIEEGISRYADWVLRQKIQDNDYYKSLNIMKGKGLLRS